MGWASHAIECLQRGENVTITPRGNSMTPLINSGDEVTLQPITVDPPVGSIVLVRCHGATYLHLIKARRDNAYGSYYQIGNNKGRVNGWVGRDAIYGIACKSFARSV